MTGDAITPDRLRMAGWDDDGPARFVHDDGPGVVLRPCHCRCHGWLWEDGDRLARLTGMADIATRFAAGGVAETRP